MKLPEGFVRFDDFEEFNDPCPICGAGKGDCCSFPDPDNEGFGIEVSCYVHQERFKNE